MAITVHMSSKLHTHLVAIDPDPSDQLQTTKGKKSSRQQGVKPTLAKTLHHSPQSPTLPSHKCKHLETSHNIRPLPHAHLRLHHLHSLRLPDTLVQLSKLKFLSLPFFFLFLVPQFKLLPAHGLLLLLDHLLLLPVLGLQVVPRLLPTSGFIFRFLTKCLALTAKISFLSAKGFLVPVVGEFSPFLGSEGPRGTLVRSAGQTTLAASLGSLVRAAIPHVVLVVLGTGVTFSLPAHARWHWQILITAFVEFVVGDFFSVRFATGVLLL